MVHCTPFHKQHRICGIQHCSPKLPGLPSPGVSCRSFAFCSPGPSISAGNPLPSSAFFSLLSCPLLGKVHISVRAVCLFLIGVMTLPTPKPSLSTLSDFLRYFPPSYPHQRNSDAKYEYNFISLHAQC